MLKPLLLTSLVASLTLSAHADPLLTEKAAVQIETMATGLNHPWGMTFLPNGSILVTERNGTLQHISADGKTRQAINGLPQIDARGQGGLLDVIIAADFSTSKTLYFSFSEPGTGGNSTAVARAKLIDDTLTDVSIIFSQQPKYDSRHHFGSRLVIDNNGKLFITTGDRGSERTARSN